MLEHVYVVFRGLVQGEKPHVFSVNQRDHLHCICALLTRSAVDLCLNLNKLPNLQTCGCRLHSTLAAPRASFNQAPVSKPQICMFHDKDRNSSFAQKLFCAGDKSCGRCGASSGSSPYPIPCTDIPPEGSLYTCEQQVKTFHLICPYPLSCWTTYMSKRSDS